MLVVEILTGASPFAADDEGATQAAVLRHAGGAPDLSNPGSLDRSGTDHPASACQTAGVPAATAAESLPAKAGQLVAGLLQPDAERRLGAEAQGGARRG